MCARAAIGCAILLALPLWASHALRWLGALDVQDVAPALCGALLGALAADGLTGLVHWACDTWGDERTRWLGPGLIRAFREHHRHPRAMLARGWIDVNREPAVAATAVLALLWLPPVQRVLDGHALAYGFVCWFVAYGAAANQIHAWAHAPAPPRAVRRLQQSGWILSPAHHAAHHRAPRTAAYCISTGWCNPLLDATGFWRGLERALTRLTGAEPRGAGRRVRMGPRNRRWQRT